MRLPPPEPDSDGPILTPVIDVVFLLLIFFLVATRFDQEEKEISTRLAEVTKAQPMSMEPNEVIVNISDDGEYIVVGETLDEPTLAAFLRNLANKNPGRQTVQIRVDKFTQFRYPARVMGLCEEEKIEHYCSVTQERK